MVRVVIMIHWRGYNPGDVAGFEPAVAARLCGGERPVAMLYQDPAETPAPAPVPEPESSAPGTPAADTAPSPVPNQAKGSPKPRRRRSTR